MSKQTQTVSIKNETRRYEVSRLGRVYLTVTAGNEDEALAKVEQGKGTLTAWDGGPYDNDEDAGIECTPVRFRCAKESHQHDTGNPPSLSNCKRLDKIQARKKLAEQILQAMFDTGYDDPVDNEEQYARRLAAQIIK